MQTPAFSDHFSAHADKYLRCRPFYPIELVDYLSKITPSHALQSADWEFLVA